MKRFFVSPWLAATAALLLAGAAHAAPPTWSYNWTPSATTIHTDDSPSTSYLKLTDQTVNNTAQTFSTDITATNISVVSDAPAGFPDEFITKGNVSFNLKIFDGVSMGSFTFNGTFNTQDPLNPSTVAIGDANAKFTNQSVAPQTLQIGQHEYTVAFNSYTPPPPQGLPGQRGLGCHQLSRDGARPEHPEGPRAVVDDPGRPGRLVHGPGRLAEAPPEARRRLSGRPLRPSPAVIFR